MAQAFAIQQQQQQQQRALAAIQQNIHTANPFLQALTLQNIAQTFMLNPTNDNLQRPRFFCYLCFKVFQSQSQYTIHVNCVHSNLIGRNQSNSTSEAIDKNVSDYLNINIYTHIYCEL